MSRTSQKWKPPSRGMFKVNFGGAVDKEANRGGIGVVIRNIEGEVVGAYTARMQWVSDPFTVKAN